MKLAIGCDEAGFYLKEEVKKHLQGQGHEIEDVGVYNTDPAMYPDVAAAVAGKVLDGQAERGILICGTGIGMAMTANKFHGIRAAVCHDSFSTERSVKSNNAQIMCMGARVIGNELAKQLASMWISYEYQDGPSTPKIDRMMYYDAKRD
ncbi:ribose 5-phosphate isomerase B [Christensenella timonensis]|uniref:ribose 5-phosphate isomerase B n=1 Tax=Christensenella timonensis TaxID=1816678 RepID=UPI00082C24BA|nr:ribose 5-phosphate isomerase B [Christensenella timonensis]